MQAAAAPRHGGDVFAKRTDAGLKQMVRHAWWRTILVATI